VHREHLRSTHDQKRRRGKICFCYACSTWSYLLVRAPHDQNCPCLTYWRTGALAFTVRCSDPDSVIDGTWVEGIDSLLSQQNQTNELAGNDHGQFILANGDGDRDARRVVIPNCPHLSFETLPYDGLGLEKDAKFIDFAYPKSLDASYTRHKEPQCGYEGNPWGYGRHHIYPLSLLANFVGSLSRFPGFHPQKDFCPWLQGGLLNEETPKKNQFFRLLQQCLPHNNQEIPRYMPWLEATASSIKGKLFNGRNVVSEQTFKHKFSDDMRVHTFRATVGLMSYMNDQELYEEFICSSRCVRNMWIAWYLGFKQKARLNAPLVPTQHHLSK
jgi:hypothetical protein